MTSAVQHAQVQGPVEYRLGDGPLQCLPHGEVEVEMGPSDVTLSWGSGETRQSTAMPKADFARYVAMEAIVVAPGLHG